MATVATNRFPTFVMGPESAPGNAFIITKSDENELPSIVSGIYVGGAGNINLITANGDTILFSAIPVGTTLRIRAKQVLSTNTSATLMVGLY